MDGNGCLSCSCSPTPSPGGNVTTPGAYHPGGCAPFDPNNCQDDCVTMDANGCLACHCVPTPAPGGNGTTPSSNGTTPGGYHPGGCAPFDPSKCQDECVKIDETGCFSCHCDPTPAPTPGSNGTTSAGGVHPGGCPSFDL